MPILANKVYVIIGCKRAHVQREIIVLTPLDTLLHFVALKRAQAGEKVAQAAAQAKEVARAEKAEKAKARAKVKARVRAEVLLAILLALIRLKPLA